MYLEHQIALKLHTIHKHHTSRTCISEFSFLERKDIALYIHKLYIFDHPKNKYCPSICYDKHLTEGLYIAAAASCNRETGTNDTTTLGHREY